MTDNQQGCLNSYLVLLPLHFWDFYQRILVAAQVQTAQIQQQVKDLVNATLQAPRVEGEEKVNAEGK